MRKNIRAARAQRTYEKARLFLRKKQKTTKQKREQNKKKTKQNRGL